MRTLTLTQEPNRYLPYVAATPIGSSCSDQPKTIETIASDDAVSGLEGHRDRRCFPEECRRTRRTLKNRSTASTVLILLLLLQPPHGPTVAAVGGTATLVDDKATSRQLPLLPCCCYRQRAGAWFPLLFDH
ncbi:unnamed protein product [Lactuca saligna]|uniref:Uncharacterized protein n=1 Tax=Lactuca saligna TaxID=75948 RepID=A0AA35YW69_LACSI|nr:unnamed protein product [Lactuca saligna]